jgi:hypothetical protein
MESSRQRISTIRGNDQFVLIWMKFETNFSANESLGGPQNISE